MIRDAILSPCRKHRYMLVRKWSDDPLLGWIMLNPSTADADADDPTIRKCIGFARQWGYGGICVGNLFTWRATDPKELLTAPELNGPMANVCIFGMPDDVIAGWGAWGSRFPARVAEVGRILRGCRVSALKLTKDGQPGHPLYIPYNTERIPWVNNDRQ